MVKLKPCPFCGGKAELVDCGIGPDRYFVRCQKCDTVQGGLWMQKQTAIKRWNRRAKDERTD